MYSTMRNTNVKKIAALKTKIRNLQNLKKGANGKAKRGNRAKNQAARKKRQAAILAKKAQIEKER